MVEKFNPAPLDKHPEDPKEAAKADREMDGNFMAGLVGTFPASDPVSATQPFVTGYERALATISATHRSGTSSRRSLNSPWKA